MPLWQWIQEALFILPESIKPNKPATAQNYGLNLLRLEDVSNGYVY